MATNHISTGLSGALFGSALLFSGVYSPDIISSQLALSDFYMLKVFLTATGSSAIIIEICKRTNIAPCKPREPSNLNRLSRYDGNIIGGLLLGCGMALTGACPGTVLVQVASGISSGLPVLAGGILGGILWSRFGYCAKCAPTPSSQTNPVISKKEHTLYNSAKMSSYQAVLLFEIVCLAVVGAASYLLPDTLGSNRLNPVLGGLLIGGAQAASLILTRGPVGVSTAYERMGDYIRRFTGLCPTKDSTWPSPSPIIFALGMLVGTWSLSNALGMSIAVETTHIPVARAVVGGIALIVGARTAGGCTSGHGISGMAGLSKASFVTVGAMFAGGIGLSGLLRIFK